MAKDLMRQFREKYSIYYTKANGVRFEPNPIFKKVSEQKNIEFAESLKETPNERIIAFKDPMVRKLIDLVTAGTLFENEAMTPVENYIPIEIHRRYKSIKSTTKKMDKKSVIFDFAGFKIIPETEHEIFYSKDPVVQDMVERRDETREFVANAFRDLAQNPQMTFAEYCEQCDEVLQRLKDIFVDATLGSNSDYAKERIAAYDNMRQELSKELLIYLQASEIELGFSLEEGVPSVETIINKLDQNPDLNNLDEISDEEINSISKLDMKKLLVDLRNNMNNEVVLYQLKSNIMNVFKNSGLLNVLRSFG